MVLGAVELFACRSLLREEADMPRNDDTLMMRKPKGPLGIIALNSFRERAKKVDEYLVAWRHRRGHHRLDEITRMTYERDTFLVDAEAPRFGSGEAKGVIMESIRGLDIYLIVDVTNYSITYKMCGEENHMSPDDHFCDLKRIIAAIEGKAERINVIMPFLYEGRQHRRTARESLDCAIALKELVAMGVDNIITFDAHDPRVQNSVPLTGLETVPPAYQFMKGICKKVPDIVIDNDHLMVISPDEGGTDRAVYLASVLGVDMGMFYKRRDYSRIENGRNPIVAHEFLGTSVEGKDVIIVDDMISSGESMIDVARELKKRKARRIFAVATFGLFTSGLARFDEAVEKGIIDKVVTTNLTYQRPELLSRDYYINCDMSKYIAYLIDSLNHDCSLSTLLNPYERIQSLVRNYMTIHHHSA